MKTEAYVPHKVAEGKRIGYYGCMEPQGSIPPVGAHYRGFMNFCHADRVAAAFFLLGFATCHPHGYPEGRPLHDRGYLLVWCEGNYLAFEMGRPVRILLRSDL
jgi:hypothetical protein